MQPDGPIPARCLIVGEAPGADEVRVGKPFIGISGHELDRMLAEVGMNRSQCLVTNVCRIRPPKNDITTMIARTKKSPDPSWTLVENLWCARPVVEGLALLKQELAQCNPRIVIVLGNLALWALTGEWGITNWRGSELDRGSYTVIPTYHPAAILRQWAWRPYAITDLRRAAYIFEHGPREKPKYAMQIRPSISQILSRISELLRQAALGSVHISADIETRHSHIDCIGIAWSKTEALCIPFISYGHSEGYWSEVEELLIVQQLRRLFSHPRILISGQNWSYDQQYLIRYWGIAPNLGLDTMVTHHVLWPGTDKSLDVLSSLYCENHVFWKEDLKEANLRQSDEQRWEYNCIDCVRTFEIAESLAAQVIKMNRVEQCLFQHRMWWHALNTMVRGVRVDKKRKTELSGELLEELTTREQWLTSILGHELNSKSPKQLQALFHEDLKLPVIISRKTGAPTLDDAALTKLCLKEPMIRPLVRRIREIRSLGVFRSTFVEARLDRDGRMRCSYNVAGTETFRLSSRENPFRSGMNLQNVPKGGDMELADDELDPLELPNVRSLFIPDPGRELFDMDLASADLRVVVWEGDVTEMKAMFAAGLNPYVEIAKEYYHDPSITKAHPKYTTFKSLCHGTNYLGKAKGIAPRVGLLINEVERVQKWYFGKFPGIEKWQNGIIDQVTKRRYVENAFGYRRFYFDRIEGNIFNQAIAWIPQSTVGLLINKIWDNIATRAPEIDILLQVHDSLVGSFPIYGRQESIAKLEQLSNVPVPYPDPLYIPTGFKTSQKSWGECG